MLWNNPSVHCEYVLFSLVNKEADWPIARRDKVRWDNQTEDTGIKGWCERVADRHRQEDGHAVLRKGTKSHGLT